MNSRLTNAMTLDCLSNRQKQCVKLFADGEPIKSIAWLLRLSQNTVDAHLRKAKEILGIANNIHLVKWAIRKKLSPL